MLALTIVCNQYGLNPFLRQIYAFPAKGGGIVPMVSIDGWIHIVNSHASFDGCEFSYQDDAEGGPYSCTCTMFVKGRHKPVVVTEFFKECFRPTDPWRTMPRRMIRHKAYIQCARVAFGLAGLFDEDEVIEVMAYDPAKADAASTVSKAQQMADRARKSSPSHSPSAAPQPVAGPQIPGTTDEAHEAQAAGGDGGSPFVESLREMDDQLHGAPSGEESQQPGKSEASDIQLREAIGGDWDSARRMLVEVLGGEVSAEVFDASLKKWAMNLGKKGKEKDISFENRKRLYTAIKAGKFNFDTGKISD
jgi:hypothetical protein